MANKPFDVFLSHNSKDKPVVRELTEALQQRGLQVWLDEEQLIPGRIWQDALEDIIETTRTAAVLIGKDGVGPWEKPEMRACLSEFVDRQLPVIPVILTNAPRKLKLSPFLKQFTWVDLRKGLTDQGLEQLEWGITGKKPKPKSGQAPTP
ncbi:MAG: toll/interleukin-1 receptor domain-containing protein, partial [Candidatus Methylumidiphilus sp.]